MILTNRLLIYGVLLAISASAAFVIVRGQLPASGVTEENDFTVMPSPCKFSEFIEAPECPEPSGIAYYPATGEMLIVDDGGRGRPPSLLKYRVDSAIASSGGSYTTLALSGKLEIGRDLEGVTVNSENGLVYVVDEASESIYEIEPGAMKHLRTIAVAPGYNGKDAFRKGGNGFEGIAFRPVVGAPLGGKFYLANQDDPTCVLRVALPAAGGEAGGEPAEVKIESAFTGEQINLGDIMWNSSENTLWLSHAWTNLLEVVDIDARKTIRWESLPGAAQEGITLDGEGRLWIAQDTGGVAVYTQGNLKYSTGG